MTGAELVALLESQLAGLRLLARVPVGEFVISDDVRIVVGSRNAVRQQKHRDAASVTQALRKRNGKRYENVTSALRNLPHTPSEHSNLSVSDPDPEFSLPDSSEENLTGSSGRARRAKPRRWTRVPADWEPSADHVGIAAAEGVDYPRELAKFRDHEFAKPRSDADAAFRNWLRAGTQGVTKALRENGTPPGYSEHRDRQPRERSMETPPMFPSEKGLQRIDPQAALAALWKVQGKTT